MLFFLSLHSCTINVRNLHLPCWFSFACCGWLTLTFNDSKKCWTSSHDGDSAAFRLRKTRSCCCWWCVWCSRLLAYANQQCDDNSSTVHTIKWHRLNMMMDLRLSLRGPCNKFCIQHELTQNSHTKHWVATRVVFSFFFLLSIFPFLAKQQPFIQTNTREQQHKECFCFLYVFVVARCCLLSIAAMHEIKSKHEYTPNMHEH